LVQLLQHLSNDLRLELSQKRVRIRADAIARRARPRSAAVATA
jgi:hypothetical protein